VAVARPRRTLVLVAIVAVLACAAIVWSAVVNRRAGTPQQSITWRIEENLLTVSAPDGRQLWTYRFDFPLPSTAYEEPHGVEVPGDQLIVFVDLDGDGARELIVLARSNTPGAGAVFCFTADGVLRFRVAAPAREVRYGAETFRGPWSPHRLFTTATPMGRPRSG
jgi:hypothetical protein